MAITPRYFIKTMGAGYNFGNMYECFNFTMATEYWRYWQYGQWKFSVTSGEEILMAEKTSAIIASAKAKEITLSFDFPNTETVDINIKHSDFVTSNCKLNFTIKSLTIDGVQKLPVKSTYEFDELNNNTSTITISYSDLTNDLSFESEVVGKRYEIIIYMSDINSLPQYPTQDNEILSMIRKHYAKSPIDSWGNRQLKEAHILAVWEAGFRSIRLPITWSGRCDQLENGHVHIDTEFFEHLDMILGMIHTEEHPFNVFINVHHDDGESGWLHTDTYLTDEKIRSRYKDYWTQISEHFKDYDYWLQFGTNNETLNSKNAWEGASVTNKDIFGLVTFQKDAHDIIRASGGNNVDRIVFYPTYAAKRGALGSSYINPDDSTDTGLWHIPYEENGEIDPYGIAEIHPYNSGLSGVQTDNEKARSYGYPIVYGEYGVSSSQLTDKNTCISQAYMVSYATYHGMGTYLWDDFGSMKMLNKDSCTLTNSKDFKKLWQGFTYDFIPSLTASANLKKVDISLTNRRLKMCKGDIEELCLDTDQPISISQEEGTSVVLNNSEKTVTAGNIGVSKVLAISYIGEYNYIDITIEDFKNTITTEYNSGWGNVSYSSWDSYKETISESFASLFIKVNGGDTIQFINPANSNKLRVREYNSSKSLITWGNEAYSLANNESHTIKSNCAYLGVTFDRTKNSDNTYYVPEGLKVLITTRDHSKEEEGFEVEDRILKACNYNNYYSSVYRYLEVYGGITYKINIGTDCDIHIIEYGKNGNIKADNWYKDRDSFKTNLFTKTIRFEIATDGHNYEHIIKCFNDKTIMPILEYKDFIDAEESKYKEESSMVSIPTDIVLDKKILASNGKIIKYNGKLINI